MKTFVTLYFLVLLPLVLQAQDIQTRIDSATEKFYEGRYDEVVAELEALLPEVVATYGRNDTSVLSEMLSALGLANLNIQQYDKAESCFLWQKSIFDSLGTTETEGYASALGNLALLYEELNDFQRAEPMYLSALRIDRQLFGNIHESVAIDLNNLATFYSAVGRYDRALPMLKEALDINRELYGEESGQYILSLNNIGQLFYNSGAFAEAEPYMKQTLALSEKVLPGDDPQVGKFLNNLAQLCLKTGRYTEALELFSRSLEILDKHQLTSSPSYAIRLNGMSRVYFNLGRYEEARTAHNRAIAIDIQSYGENNLMVANDLNLISMTSMATGRYSEANEYNRKSFAIYSDMIRNNTGFLSNAEIEQFISTFFYHLDFYQSFNLRQSEHLVSSGDFAYDIELARKGLLLRSAGAVRKRIHESGDTALQADYQRMVQLRDEVSLMPSFVGGEPNARKQEAMAMANDLEKQISLRSREFRQNMEDQNISWKEVQKHLGRGEAAIEFSRFEIFSGKEWSDTVIYCAILVRQGDSLPVIVRLCDEKALRSAMPPVAGPSAINGAYLLATPAKPGLPGQAVRERNRLYSLLWRPLEKYLDGLRTVCYSPAGLINLVNLDALPLSEGMCLAEKYLMVRMGSTRDLVNRVDRLRVASAVVYGGINYDSLPSGPAAPRNDLAEERKKEPDASQNFYGSLRAGFGYLPGTMEEARKVSARLKTGEIGTTLYSGSGATEETFGMLSGPRSPGLIHISTHGFYLPDTLSKRSRRYMSLPETGAGLFRYAEDPLLRSGLLMAGANLTWKGRARPEGTEDGILTAREVSDMNLASTQLVVLSACQTGLGDVKGSEGVEGLARGFRMAGVQNIIMSLWQVPDRETTEFMEKFYDTWLKGGDLREAFRQTGISMKRKYPSEPFKWAGFVMVE